MKRIGQTESQLEDPSFTHLLATLIEGRKTLREFYIMARSVAASGKQFNENLEKFCGFTIRSEDVFTKEVEFINKLEENVCSALGRIVNKDLNRLDEAIVQYKSAKLKFDSLHYKTVKQMKKKGITVTVEKADDIMQAHADLPARFETYCSAKLNVRAQRDVILTRLKTKVGDRLEELRLVSDAQHHQLYCRYLKERLTKIVVICTQEPSREELSTLGRGNSFSQHRSHLSVILSKSVGVAGNIEDNESARSYPFMKSLRTEDQKDTEPESSQSTENRTSAVKERDENEGTASVQKHKQNQAQNVIPPGADDSKKHTVEE